MASEKEASEESALEETVVGLLKKKKMTLSLAESCTGGAVAADIVNVPDRWQKAVRKQPKPMSVSL